MSGNDTVIKPLQTIAFQKELVILTSAWDRARVGIPQWVAIVGETGIGKTNLIQQFFHLLSTGYDPENYWPASLPNPMPDDESGYVLRLNPDPQQFVDCGDVHPSMPWMWWALCGSKETGARQKATACAVVAQQRHLAVHVARYINDECRKKAATHTAVRIAKIAAGFVPILGPLVEAGSLASEARETFHDLKEYLGAAVVQGIASVHDQAQMAARDQCLTAIREILRRQIPFVLVLDDSQWLGTGHDAETCQMMQALMDEAASQAYKLMIVSTCWTKSWRSARRSDVVDRGTSIHDVFVEFEQKCADSAHTITEVCGVSKAVAADYIHACFPGLSDADVYKLAGKADGNFRYLHEICRHLASPASAGYFDGEDPTKGLSSMDGEAFIGDLLGSSMETLIGTRLRNLDSNVRDALVKSSFQGPRFSIGLTQKVVDATVPAESARNVAAEITMAETEEGFTIPADDETDAESFQHGPYCDVARKELDKIPSKKAKVVQAYKEIVVNLLDEGNLSTSRARLLERVFDNLNTDERNRALPLLIRWKLDQHRYTDALVDVQRLVDSLCPDEKPNSDDGRMHYVNIGLKCGASGALSALETINHFGFLSPIDGVSGVMLESQGQGFAECLQGNVLFPFQQSGRLADGWNLERITDATAAVMEYHFAFGRKDDELAWRLKTVNMWQRRFVKATADTTSGNEHQFPASTPTDTEIAAAVLAAFRYCEACLPYIRSPADWDEMESLRGTALEWEQRIRNPSLESLLVVLLQSLHVTAKRLTMMYANASRDDVKAVYRKMARHTGNLLSECPELDRTHFSADSCDTDEAWVDQLDDWLSNVTGGSNTGIVTFILAAGRTIEAAVLNNFDLPNEFLARLFVVVKRVCNQILDRERYVSPSLMSNLMECLADIAAAARRAAEPEWQRARADAYEKIAAEAGSHGLHPVLLPGVPITTEDARSLANDVRRLVAMFRTQAGGHVDVMVENARAWVVYLRSTKEPTREDLDHALAEMLEDAALSRDGYRVAIGEPTLMLPWIVRLYDGWLSKLLDCDATWRCIEDAYVDCGGAFEALVADIREYHGD